MAWQPQASVPTGFADEESLLAGLRAGRREAFESLHGDFAAPIYNLALRIVDDPQDAQDVTQEVLIKVFRSPPQSSGPGFSLAAWLYRVTVNASFDHLRARKRRPVIAMDAEREPAAVVDEYERAELAGRVDQTLRSLPKRQQVALVLRDVHGLTVGETANVLGVTRGSADVLLSRARRSFRRVFLADGDDSVAAPAACTVADEVLAGSVGGGLSDERRARLLEHARTCPECRRTVDLWGVAPVGLGLLVSQAALPAELSLTATFAAASAAGVAIPAAGLGAVGAVGAAGAASAAGGSAGAVAGGAAAGAACGPAGAAGAGLVAKIGAAVGLKAVAVAAAATVAVGAAGVAGHEVDRTTDGPPGGAARTATSGLTQADARGGAGLGGAPGALARERLRPASGPGEEMGDGERSRFDFAGRAGAGGRGRSSRAGDGGAKYGGGAGGSIGRTGSTGAGAGGRGSAGTGPASAGRSDSGADTRSGSGTGTGGLGSGAAGAGAGGGSGSEGSSGSGGGSRAGGGSSAVDDPGSFRDPSGGGRSGA